MRLPQPSRMTGAWPNTNRDALARMERVAECGFPNSDNTLCLERFFGNEWGQE
jgi:hypothetical protein